MKPDRWTKACLTVIAASLAILALRPMVPVAHAADVIKCEIDGGLVVESFKDELEVKVQAAFSSPGSSKSSPMYVEVDRD